MPSRLIALWRENRRIISLSGLITICLAAALIPDVQVRLASAFVAATRECRNCSVPSRVVAATVAFTTGYSTRPIPTIVGGRDTDPTEFPRVGSVIVDGDLRCTGTLLTAHTVLTAAHCVYDIGRQYSRVGFREGIVSLSVAPANIVCALKIPDAVPFRYDPATHAHDIALLYLCQAADDSSSRYTLDADPALVSRLSASNDFVDFVGFGYISFARIGDGRQRAAIMRIAGIDTARANTFTYGSSAVSVCYRDSGGPAITSDRIIIGVTSETVGCRKGIDIRLAPYASWLSGKIKS